jgi:hypothetical protein
MHDPTELDPQEMLAGPSRHHPWRASLTAALALAACSSTPAATGTGLHVSATWTDAPIDQLEYAAVDSGGMSLHPAERRPEVAAGLLASGADVMILLPDRLAGLRLRCVVTGYGGGRALRRGEVQVTVTAGTIVEAQVVLDGTAGGIDGGPGQDAGMDGAPDRPGDGPRTDVLPDVPSALGQACAAAGECATGHCVDGVCCDTACTGTCRSCNVPGRVGRCSMVPAGGADARCTKQPVATCGLDGTCDGNGGCRKYPQGTTCVPGACNGNTVTGAGSCDGNGICVTGGSTSCGAYTCDQAAGACRTRCASSNECVAPNLCSTSGMCGNLKPLGQTCTSGAECTTGSCTDGVCCQTASCGACYTCNLDGGSAGTCRPVQSGKPDPHGLCPVQQVSTCGTNGLCNGSGACSLYPDGTSCRLARTCLNGACR